MILTQNLYNYASLEVNVRKLAGEYVNGKIIKRIIVLIGLSCHNSMFHQSRREYSIYNEPVSDVVQNHREQIILFGAIGRHNFGDLLFAEVFEKNLMNLCDISGYDVFFADILPRNMTIYGGRNVAGITSFMNSSAKTHVVHVGGETTNCSIKFALHMFDPDLSVPEVSTSEWKKFESNSPLAYIVNQSFFANPGSFVANSIGFLPHSNVANEIVKGFDYVSTRNYPGTEFKKFAPDSVITIRENFENKILAHRPDISNYVAVQFRYSNSSEMITAIAEQLVKLIKVTNLTVVFFRAGAALGHDSIIEYGYVKDKMALHGVENRTDIFTGLNIWDITSLIANAELVIGTSLHVRVIAFAYSVPRVTFNAGGKHLAMIKYWDFGAIACNIEVTLATGIYKTALATMRCKEFKNEKHSHLAEKMYMEMFARMIDKMGICTLSSEN